MERSSHISTVCPRKNSRSASSIPQHTRFPFGAYADRSDGVPTCPVMTPFSGQSVQHHSIDSSVQLTMRMRPRHNLRLTRATQGTAETHGSCATRLVAASATARVNAARPFAGAGASSAHSGTKCCTSVTHVAIDGISSTSAWTRHPTDHEPALAASKFGYASRKWVTEDLTL